jgi:hypothetical protein
MYNAEISLLCTNPIEIKKKNLLNQRGMQSTNIYNHQIIEITQWSIN